MDDTRVQGTVQVASTGALASMLVSEGLLALNDQHPIVAIGCSPGTNRSMWRAARWTSRFASRTRCAPTQTVQGGARRGAGFAREFRLREGMSHAPGTSSMSSRPIPAGPSSIVLARLALGAALLTACAQAPVPPRAAEAQTTIATTTAATSTSNEATPAPPPATEITTSSQGFCDLVCERARALPRPADEPDYNAEATDNANAVLEGMHDDLLSCYKKRVLVNPNAHGFITVDIVIGPDGHVQNVETTGGAVLGDGTMACMVRRIRDASFARPHGGGTLRIHVPFSLRRVGPGDLSL